MTGAGIWVDNRVDFTRAVNLFVAAVTLIIGARIHPVVGGFTLNGITLGTFTAIILYQLFKGPPEQEDFAILGDDVEARAEMRAE